MIAHFEPISGNLRLFKDGKYGDRYDWSCRVEVIDGIAHLSLVQKMIHGVKEALILWGRKNDISEFRWMRYRRGEKKLVRYMM